METEETSSNEEETIEKKEMGAHLPFWAREILRICEKAEKSTAGQSSSQGDP